MAASGVVGVAPCFAMEVHGGRLSWGGGHALLAVCGCAVSVSQHAAVPASRASRGRSCATAAASRSSRGSRVERTVVVDVAAERDVGAASVR